MRHLATIFAASAKSKSYWEDFKCRVSAENLHYVFDIGDHPTADSSGKFQVNVWFQVKVRFNLSNGRQKGQAHQ